MKQWSANRCEEEEGEEKASSPDDFPVCTKHPGHKEFTLAGEFSMNHLPEPFRNQIILHSILTLSSLTCRLLVHQSSKNRPDYCPLTKKPYPFNKQALSSRGVLGTRAGSGFVSRVEINDSDTAESVCPCDQCESSSFPEKQWAQVTIATARHVVFDESEARNTDVEFFYDSEEERDRRIRILKGQDAKYIEDVGTDICWVVCITHDIELANTLALLYNENKRAHSELIRASIKTMPITFPERHSENKCLDSDVLAIPGQNDFHSIKIKKPLEIENVQQVPLKSVPDRDDSTKVRKLIISFKRGREIERTEIKLAPSKRRRIRIVNPDVSCRLQKHLPFAVYYLDRLHLGLDLSVKEKIPFLHAPQVAIKDSPEPNDKRCNNNSSNNISQPAWRLAAIVSHPHGMAKRISIGSWLDRREEPNALGMDHVTSYVYNTPACPGSSGAPLWLLHSLHAFRHVHSRSLEGGLNQSSIGLDSSLWTDPRVAKMRARSVESSQRHDGSSIGHVNNTTVGTFLYVTSGPVTPRKP